MATETKSAAELSEVELLNELDTNCHGPDYFADVPKDRLRRVRTAIHNDIVQRASTLNRNALEQFQAEGGVWRNTPFLSLPRLLIYGLSNMWRRLDTGVPIDNDSHRVHTLEHNLESVDQALGDHIHAVRWLLITLLPPGFKTKNLDPPLQENVEE